MTTANRRRRRRQPRSSSALSLSCCILTAAMAASPSTAESRSDPRSPLLRAEALFPFTARRFRKDVDVTKLSTRCESLDYITGPMDDADADGNGFLSKEEYVDFTDAISGGFLTEGGYDEEFRDMPLSLQETYLVLSCLCELYPNQAWGGKGCCENPDAGEDNTGIRTEGTGEGERPTKQERQYLIYVCGTMSESLKFVGSELVAPTTEMPTQKPTPPPTPWPTKMTTTPLPIQEPTKRPSPPPTPPPSSEPTPFPAQSPSPAPVQPRPVTSSPTTKDSNSVPEGSPTKNPTRRPIASPPTAPFLTEPLEDRNPTGKPTSEPTVPEGSPSRSPVQAGLPTPGGSPPTSRPDGGTGPATLGPTTALTPRPTVPPGSPTRAPVDESTERPTPALMLKPTVPPGSPSRAPIEMNKQTERPIPAPISAPTVSERSPSRSPLEAGTPTGWPAPGPDETAPAGDPPTYYPTLRPTNPTSTVQPTPNPSKLPTEQPSISFAPTISPAPSASPTASTAPTISSSPSASPTVTSSPTSSSVPSSAPIYTGDAPASVDFVASLKSPTSQVTAAEVMTGERNQVKAMLEEQLLILSGIVIEEQFHSGEGTERRLTVAESNAASKRWSDEPSLQSKRKARENGDRQLIVEEATSAEVDLVEDVPCPAGSYVGADPDDPSPTSCLYFTNTVYLSMVNEPDADSKVAVFESAMLAKIAEGWLVDNFDLEEALKPPPPTPPSLTPPMSTPPTPPSKKSDRIGGPSDTEPLEPQPLSVGAIIGIVIAILACMLLGMIFIKSDLAKPKNEPPHDVVNDLETPLERSSMLAQSNISGLDLHAAAEGDDYTVNTADKSYTSRDHLLSSRPSSSAVAHAMSPMPELGEVSHDDMDRGTDSEVEDSIYSEEKHTGDNNALTGATQIAAMAAASTLVASHNPTPLTPPNKEISVSPISHTSMTSPYSSPEKGFSSMEKEEQEGGCGGSLLVGQLGKEAGQDSLFGEGGRMLLLEGDYNATGFVGDVGARSTVEAEETSPSAAPQVVAALGVGSGGGGGAAAQVAGAEGGFTAGAAAALGAAGVGVITTGPYATTRSHTPPQSQGSVGSSADTSSITSPTQSTPSAMDDLDAAIEAGNWGHVGALAAVLASQGHGSHRRSGASVTNITASKSEGAGTADSDSRSSRSSSAVEASLDQTRAVEIDRLVESGDWQGVVLAAARFEADQTFDGESSFSASGASQSSGRWTGSATSATTPRSMATTDRTSTSNLSSQRGQAEIRAEVEALVKRVVPEEADNIDEMMTQFKGREEELVETLRRMQERAIASRARLAVQKSAKLEAKAKAIPKKNMSQQSSMSQSVGISSSTRGGASLGGCSVTSISSTKSELEQAIEAGNWQAVGAAAQRMSDQSVGELSTEEVARLREAISQSRAFNRQHGSPDSTDFQLDALIEQGDWPGVIAAAKSASEERHSQESKEAGRMRSMIEEQEALAQANMWQEIADQSKQEACQGPAGATDATAWAIQRSLRAMDSNTDAGNKSGEPRRTSGAAQSIMDLASDESSVDGFSQYESSSFSNSAGSSDEYDRTGI